MSSSSRFLEAGPSEMGKARSKYALVVFCLMLSPGCAGRGNMQRTEAGTSPRSQKLPFDQSAGSASAGNQGRLAVPASSKSSNEIPFHAASPAHVLPSGTLLTVQLESSLLPPHLRSGDVFTAQIADPVIVDGETLVAPGALVSGKVESEQTSIDRTRPGSSSMAYARLTLQAMMVDDKRVALQTSSLFAKGTPPPARASSTGNRAEPGILIRKGRRLTFRLTAPVQFGDVGAMANRQTFTPPVE